MKRIITEIIVKDMHEAKKIIRELDNYVMEHYDIEQVVSIIK